MAETVTRGESHNGGESADSHRQVLAQRLEARGHGQCAYDLEAADDCDVVRVAYEIAEHVEYACGNDQFADEHLAADIRAWAALQQEQIITLTCPEVPEIDPRVRQIFYEVMEEGQQE